jgi:hypothetical protein
MILTYTAQGDLTPLVTQDDAPREPKVSGEKMVEFSKSPESIRSSHQLYISLVRRYRWRQHSILRNRSTIVALGLEDLVVDMDEIAVPRKELADVVNDSSEVLVEGFQIAIPTCYCCKSSLSG